MASISFKDLLMKITDSSRIGPGEFIFKEMCTRPLQHVIMTLAVAHMHELPVYNTQLQNYQVFGLWDLLPCLIQVIEEWKDDTSPSLPSDNALNEMKAAFQRKLRMTVAETLAVTPSLHEFVPIQSVHALYEVVECMLENNHPQISITTDNNVLLNVITVELIMRFIYINRLRLHQWYFNMTVGELNLGGSDPLGTVRDSDLTIEAFKFMNKNQVSCVAVVDADKHVVGCINLNDLQVIFKPKRSIADLFLSAANFIQLGKFLSKGVIPAPFAMCATCTKDTTVGELVNHAIRNRAWNFLYLEEDNTVSRLITSRDIIGALFTAEQRIGFRPPVPKSAS